MAFAHQRLDPTTLSPTVRKLSSSESPMPMRLMAARGLAPLPPPDLLVALYQFWVANEAPLTEEAAKTLPTLPNPILLGALANASLPAGVLDFIARKVPRNDEVMAGLIRHPQVHDETLAGLARLCSETICDQLADNQTRWLGCPAIIESLYQNPQCRMSVVHRVLELAVRQGVDIKLPNIEEIRIALGDSEGSADPERDALFREATGAEVAEDHSRIIEQTERSLADDTLDFDAAQGPPLPDSAEWSLPAPDDDLSLPVDETSADDASEDDVTEDLLDVVADTPKGDRVTVISRLRPMEKIRLALLGSAFERAILIRDSNKAVSLSAIKSPRVKENEAVAYAANRTLNPEVIRYIARRREWTKLYQVKLSLVLNPKTPMSAAMGFLGHLQAHDIRKVARSRNIPSALAQAAKRKGDQRR